MAITYEPIATTTLGSAAASVTFSSISGSYTDLVLVIWGRTSTGGGDVICQFNSDTGSNYSWTRLSGDGSSAASSRSSNSTNIRLTVAAYPDSTNATLVLASINNYSNSTTYKTVLTRANQTGQAAEAIVGLWRNTNAITSIVVTSTPNNFNSGATFTLYGIKAA